MKRLACAAMVLGLGLLAPGRYARAAEAAAESGGNQEKEPSEIWKWANFALLAGGLGYLVAKNAPAFFAARSKKIVEDMTGARKLREEAEARAANVDLRLANLESDIAALRGESQAQAAAEAERLKAHAASELAKIQALAEREIEAAGKAARMELRRFAAQLATDLAQRKIEARMTPETQDGLVRGFVHDLGNPPSGAQRN
ncbi:MAG TPA: ATP synthase F0 subunit B [Bryobacteraceae bacterium]|nr:ATP synthase F0 subunit B [Bryobacteraceae bacterium]